MLEAQKTYSVGRGTDAPFEQIGADWINGRQLSAYLNARFIPGVRTYATGFQPTSSNFAGKSISGVRFVITDREAFNPARLGVEIAAALQPAELRERLALDGIEIVGSTPDEFAAFVRQENDKWGKVIRAAGIKLE